MYILDKHDAGYWIIRKQGHMLADDSMYPAGTSKTKAVALMNRLERNGRAKIDSQHETLLVCWGLHEWGEPCEWVVEIKNVYGKGRK